MQYRGFVLPSVKLLIQYRFPSHILKIQRNSSKLQFDIYLSKYDHNDCLIDMDEINTFKQFFGPGLNLIVLSPEDLTSTEDLV